MARKVYKDKLLEVTEIKAPEISEKIFAEDFAMAKIATETIDTEVENSENLVPFEPIEILDLFTSYLSPVISFKETSTENGSCRFCGVKTTKKERCACVNCINLYGKELYDSIKISLERE